jgi:hypothetical protein
VPWVDDDNGFDYRLLKSGALEFRDRRGRYQLVWGCTANGWHEFWERLDLIRDLLTDIPPDSTLESLYLEHPEFRRHCDQCLTLSGIDPDDVSPVLMRHLLFPTDAETPAPLVALNTPYPARKPPLPGGDGISNRVELLAALAAVCEGNLADAVALANSTPARDLFTALESRAWAMASDEQKDRAILSEEKRKAGEAMRGRKKRTKKVNPDG